MKIRFIINPIAGGANRLKKITEAVRELSLKRDGLFDIKAAKGGAHVGELSEEAVKMGFDIVYACGGDGTINGVACKLVNTETILGIIPAGSGNALAAALHIPREIKAAVGLLDGMQVREIDAGFTCNRYFFSTAGFGIEAYLSKQYNGSRVIRKIRGVGPYFPLALAGYLTYRPGLVKIAADGMRMDMVPLILTAANTDQFGRGAYIAPGAKPDDGALDLCLAPVTNLRGALALAGRLFSRKIDKSQGFKRVRVREISITGRGEWVCHVDGEPFDWSGDISIKVVQKALKVLVKG
ncbi:MAG: hypothetical protein HY954_01705 [Deltaproteobacteria bacterium]|nr:hypothetical protein [Deltaproteobacteria bacterium]